MKSPALREAMRPLRLLEKKAFEAFEGDIQQWRAERELHKLQREADKSNALKRLKKGETVEPDALTLDCAGDEPQPRRYVVNDSSVEALGEILRYNPSGALAYRDELVGLLKSLDKEGSEGARGFYSRHGVARMAIPSTASGAGLTCGSMLAVCHCLAVFSLPSLAAICGKR